MAQQDEKKNNEQDEQKNNVKLLTWIDKKIRIVNKKHGVLFGSGKKSDQDHYVQCNPNRDYGVKSENECKKATFIIKKASDSDFYNIVQQKCGVMFASKGDKASNGDHYVQCSPDGLNHGKDRHLWKIKQKFDNSNIFWIDNKEYGALFVADKDKDGSDHLVECGSHAADNEKAIFSFFAAFDVKFIKIDFDVNFSNILESTPVEIDSAILTNGTSVDQTMEWTSSVEHSNTSSFSHESGVELSIGMEFSGGIPGFAQGKETISATSRMSYTWGQETTITKQYALTAKPNVPAGGSVKVTAALWTKRFDVPYVIKIATFDGIKESHGTYKGVDSLHIEYDVQPHTIDNT